MMSNYFQIQNDIIRGNRNWLPLLFAFFNLVIFSLQILLQRLKSYPNLLLIKEDETISHHKMIEGIVIGNLLQREIGIKDVAYLQ